MISSSYFRTSRIPRLVNLTPRHIKQLLLGGLFIATILFVSGTYRVNLKVGTIKIPPTQDDWIPDPEEDNRRLNIQYGDDMMDTEVAFAQIKTDRGPWLISVYPKNEDPASAALLSDGQWQTELVESLQSIFACDPEMHFIDIGAGLGLLTTVAASWQRRVIAVDASLDNIRKIRQTIMRQQCGSVTVLHNAVYDKSAIVQVIHSISNRSASFLQIEMDELDNLDPYTEFYNGNKINTIYLDDLKPILEAVGIRRAVLRMDLDDSKYNALAESRGLFNQFVKIPYILMNWSWKRYNHDKEALAVIRYLTSIGYVAYNSFMKPMPLDNRLRDLWPKEIIWFREGETCSTWGDLQAVRKAYRMIHSATRYA